jgi:predicted Zn-dependent protease
MRSSWIVETGSLEAPDEIKPDETNVTAAAAVLFATGYSALLSGNVEGAESAAQQIDGRRETASHGPLCDMTSGFDSTTKRDLLVAEVLQKSLSALVAVERGKTDEALALLDEATAVEESMPLDFGPPIIVKPSHEVYGELLLQIEQPAEAQLQFRKALARAPRRSLSLAGLASAARATGDQATLRYACAELSATYARADAGVGVPEACR